MDRYKHVRLHNAIGYETPSDMLGRQADIHAERDRNLEEARQQRQLRRRQAYADADRLIPIGQCKTLQLAVSVSSSTSKA